ncbi:MAG TPA: hypothetical protein VJS92_02915, partial [Candidatus Polarisedimenticolaceae bacterium]|nr:hypothetical protein [Candidatus Polarisedimenticolaceae bacterium]
RLGSPLAGWCRGEFRPGHPGAYAVAVATAPGGRYWVLEPGADATDLAAFKGSADLSCYTPDEARALGATIGRSETVEGAIAPRFGTTVVCGFLEPTSAVCWQWSPAEHAFVKVGEWTT